MLASGLRRGPCGGRSVPGLPEAHPWIRSCPEGVSWEIAPPREPLFAALERAAARGAAAPPALRRSWPHLARYYHARVLPLSAAPFARIMAGSGLLALEGVAPGARPR